MVADLDREWVKIIEKCHQNNSCQEGDGTCSTTRDESLIIRGKVGD